MKRAVLVIVLASSIPAFSFWPFEDPLRKERLETELHPNSSFAWGRLAYAAWQKEMWGDVEAASKKAIKTAESVTETESGYRYLFQFYKHVGDAEMAKMCLAKSGVKEQTPTPPKESKEDIIKRLLAPPPPPIVMPANLKPLPPLKLAPMKYEPPPPIPVFTATPPPSR